MKDQNQQVFSYVAGTVSKFFPQFGYGFIKPDQGGKDVHFHVDCACRIKAGQKVPEFTPGDLHWPKHGARIVCKVGSMTPTASVAWGYEYYYVKALTEIKNRPIFRIMKQDSFRGETTARPPKVAGVTGVQIGELITLLAQGKITFWETNSQGPMVTTQWFEKKVGDGPWVKLSREEAVEFNLLTRRAVAA